MQRSNKKKRILITGGTGFLGSYALRYFVTKGYTVRVLLRKKNAEKFKNLLNIDITYGDLKNRRSLFTATKNVDLIINFAALKSDEKDSYDVNVKGVMYLIDASKKNNVSKIIQISTISTKIKKLGIYGKTKAQADKLLIESGIPVVILRPSIVYDDLKNGVFGSLVKASNWPIIPIIGDGKCFFNPIHVEDLIKATEIAAVEKKLNGKTYDVGGPDKITFNALVQLLAKKRKRKSYVLHIPIIFGLIIAGILSKIFYHPPITVSNILGSTQKVTIDVQTFFNDFHFKPRSLQQGITPFFTKSDYRFKEAKIFFSYIMPKKFRTNLPDEIYERYNYVLRKNNISSYKNLPRYFPFILGPMDAFSKIFFPVSRLQKKLTITATLIEATPYSAGWLLPSSYSVSENLLLLFGIFITTVVKFIIGFLFFLVPGLYEKYVI